MNDVFTEYLEYLEAERRDIAERYGPWKCSDCIYWLIGWQGEKKLGQGHLVEGECRKRAPLPHFTILDGLGELLGLIAHATEEAANIEHDAHAPYDFINYEGFQTFWPRTEEESWCGEFRPGRKPISAESLARIEALHEKWEAEKKTLDESADSSP